MEPQEVALVQDGARLAAAASTEEGSAVLAGIASLDGIEEEISRAGAWGALRRLLSKLLTE